jgi:hypothetical protein
MRFHGVVQVGHDRAPSVCRWTIRLAPGPTIIGPGDLSTAPLGAAQALVARLRHPTLGATSKEPGLNPTEPTSG